MNKVLFTLCVDNYAPEITEITMPLLRSYAKKIGADFYIINERRYPDFPPVYEKMQISELGKNNDWNIYMDADTLIHPDTFDFTNHMTKDYVMHHGCDMAGNRWKYDRFFLRDGRHIGSGNWMAAASDWCTPEFWKPLDDLTFKEAVKNIQPTFQESKHGITPEHLIDDYTMSRNIAKYGLKFTTFFGIMQNLKHNGDYFWHQYLVGTEEKVKQMNEVLVRWGLKEAPKEAPGENTTDKTG
jgi:hypothetical protein